MSESILSANHIKCLMDEKDEIILTCNFSGLSANAVAGLSIECLMDEKDVKGFIKREEFENLESGLLEKFNIPCNKAGIHLIFTTLIIITCF